MGKGADRTVRPKTTLFGRLLRLLGALVLLLVVALGVCWFAFRDDILDRVITTAEHELSEGGLYTKFGSSHLTWNGSVELDGFELFADEDRVQRIGHIGELFIRIPLADLLRGDSRMVVSSSDSELGIMAEAGELRLERLRFEFEVNAETLSIRRFESQFQGLKVTADGVIRRNTAEDEEPEMFVMPDLSPIVEAASWLEFSEGDPTVSLHVGPPADADDGHQLKVAFQGSDFRWKSMFLNEARFEVVHEEGGVELQSMSLAGYGGTLSGSLLIDSSNGQLVLRQVESSMDPFRLIEALPISESAKASMKGFRSLGATTVRSDELRFDLAEFSNSTGTVRLAAKKGVGMAWSGTEIVLTDLTAKVTFGNGTLAVVGERFGLFGGWRAAHAEFRFPERFAIRGISMPAGFRWPDWARRWVWAAVRWGSSRSATPAAGHQAKDRTRERVDWK